MLTERLGDGSVQIRSSGFGPVDLPAIDDAVDAMRRRGLDVSAHRSSTTTASLVDGADLILTAERDHVVKIAALSSDAFRRAMTLPEFLALAATSGGDPDLDVRSWVRVADGGTDRCCLPPRADRRGRRSHRVDAASVRGCRGRHRAAVPRGHRPRRWSRRSRPLATEPPATRSDERTVRRRPSGSSQICRVGGTGGIRTPEPCGRPLSRRLHSSTLPPFRSRGYRATLRGSQERCQSGRMGRPAKALIVVTRSVGSNPTLSATRPACL